MMHTWLTPSPRVLATVFERTHITMYFTDPPEFVFSCQNYVTFQDRNIATPRPPRLAPALRQPGVCCRPPADSPLGRVGRRRSAGPRARKPRCTAARRPGPPARSGRGASRCAPTALGTHPPAATTTPLRHPPAARSNGRQSRSNGTAPVAVKVEQDGTRRSHGQTRRHPPQVKVKQDGTRNQTRQSNPPSRSHGRRDEAQTRQTEYTPALEVKHDNVRSHGQTR